MYKLLQVQIAFGTSTTATSSKHTNDPLSSINISFLPLAPPRQEPTNSRPLESFTSLIDGINTTSRSEHDLFYCCTTVVYKFIEWCSYHLHLQKCQQRNGIHRQRTVVCKLSLQVIKVNLQSKFMQHNHTMKCIYYSGSFITDAVTELQLWTKVSKPQECFLRGIVQSGSRCIKQNKYFVFDVMR